MYPFLIKYGLKKISKKLRNSMFNDTLNPDEAYADRIARDFGIEWHDARDAYHQNPGFWEESYKGDPRDPRNTRKMAPVKRTSRLPASFGVQERDTLWESLFSGRVSLRRAQDDWRE
ncbi:hypothetical protein I6F26_13720 [Ensifer sp. IC3342]|nr:hypothetical protein [Ensifer sp. BRP08]MCA1447637.1 hypothetical protein [Ensifer sp. IC3342]